MSKQTQFGTEVYVEERNNAPAAAKNSDCCSTTRDAEIDDLNEYIRDQGMSGNIWTSWQNMNWATMRWANDKGYKGGIWNGHQAIYPAPVGHVIGVVLIR